MTNKPAETILEERCGDFEVIRDGEYVYENNVWNKDAATQHGDTYRQCVRRREIAGRQEIGWIWSWPSRFEPSVYAYPEVIFGKKPWSNGDSTTAGLPASLASLNQLALEYDVETVIASGAYNLAPEAWITTTGTNPTQADVAAELMFWMDYRDTNPAGDKVDQLVIDGREYEVFFKPDMGSNPGWKYVAFRALQREPSRARLRIGEFLRYTIDKGYVDGNHFLSSVELGNEISSGSGHTWVKRFVVTP